MICRQKYVANLNEQEVKALTQKYKTAKDVNSVALSESLRTELYNAGKEFGKSLNVLIKSKIGM